MEIWKHKFEIKKDRWVYVPSSEMSKFGKKLHSYIKKQWLPPLYYYHMRAGGHVAAAALHKENYFFALIDIRHFFESTSQSRVTRELKTIFPYKKAREIAKLSTVRVPGKFEAKFSIPYGFPQSPIVATLCLNNSFAGRLIDSINTSGLVKISVYMDDIIISAKGFAVLNNCFEELCEALKRSHYDLNDIKTQPPAERITAFNLELSHRDLRIRASRLVEFISAYAQTEDLYEKEGIRSYVKSINLLQAQLHFP